MGSLGECVPPKKVKARRREGTWLSGNRVYRNQLFGDINIGSFKEQYNAEKTVIMTVGILYLPHNVIYLRWSHNCRSNPCYGGIYRYEY